MLAAEVRRSRALLHELRESSVRLRKHFLDRRTRHAEAVAQPHGLGDEACGDIDSLAEPRLRLLCVSPSHPAAADGERREQNHRGGDALIDADPAAGRDQFALPKVVEGYAEQAGDQLQLGVVLAIALGAQVRGDRLGKLFGQHAVGTHLKAQRGREALPIARACIRLSVADDGEDAVAPAEPLELADLLVDPKAFRCGRAADDDQTGRVPQRRANGCAQVGRGRELVAVTENREYLLADRTVATRLADKRLRHAVALDRLVQPLRPFAIAMAVADEGWILEGGCCCGRCVHIPPRARAHPNLLWHN
jgi:hypothetical protein